MAEPPITGFAELVREIQWISEKMRAGEVRDVPFTEQEIAQIRRAAQLIGWFDTLGWMTGHLWLDISLAEQKQTPLCFCLDCAPVMAGGADYPIAVTDGIVVPPPSIEDRRARATMDKVELLVAMRRADLITLEEFEIAAAGGFPDRIAAALADLPAEDRAIAAAKWRNDTVINRTNPVILAAAAALGITDEQADALFGIAG